MIYGINRRNEQTTCCHTENGRGSISLNENTLQEITGFMEALF